MAVMSGAPQQNGDKNAVLCGTAARRKPANAVLTVRLNAVTTRNKDVQ
jgi:hypothetical protein